MTLKKLIFLPIFFLAIFCNAQTTVDYLGFVNYPDGTPLDITENVRIFSVNPTGGVFHDSVVTVVNGEFSGSFQIDSAQNQIVIVTAGMVDCTGDTITTAGFWFSGDSAVAILNLVYCDSTGYEDCYTWLSSDPISNDEMLLNPETFGVGPFTYLWSTGEETETINVSEDGDYCVTVTDAENCMSEACKTIDIDSINTLCIGTIGRNNTGTNEVTLTGVPFYPFDSTYTYVWTGPENFTSTERTIVVTVPGQYCVTMVSADGECTMNACTEVFFFPNDSCFVNIFETGGPNQLAQLTAYHLPEGNWTYSWNSGEISQNMFPTTDGTYCVTITNDVGCSATDCYAFISDTIPDVCVGVISGEYISSAQAQLNAEAFPNPLNFTYSWTGPNNFNSAEQDIIVSVEGEYCVEMISMEDSCTIVDCYTVDFTPFDSCGVSIYSNNPWGGLGLLAYPWGTPPFSYIWSTDEITEGIIPTVDGIYCVTVTDAFGCIATECFDYMQDTTYNDSCYVWIGAGAPTGGGWSLAAYTNFFGEYTFEWTGPNNFISTEQYITVSEDGEYCVTATNVFGCVATDCIDFEVPDTCFASISTTTSNPDGTGDWLLTAQANGVAPFAYQWNTGANTDSITVSIGGEYCVTVTDAEGCASEACIFAAPIDSLECDLLLLQIDTGGVTYLLALPLTYTNGGDVIWSTGDTSLFIQADGPGDYCATFSSPVCTVTKCVTIDQIIRRSIYGNVGGQYNPTNTDVSLYHEGLDDTFADIDHSSMYNNAFGAGFVYGFDDVETGTYLVRAQSRAINSALPLIPTYNGNVVFWDEATPLSVIEGTYTADIELATGINVQGTASISGYVEEGLGGIRLNARSGVENPLPNASMILLNQFGQVVNHDPSDVAGAFDFSNLPYGTYQIHINIPGVDREMVEVTLTPNNPTAENIIFSVNGSAVVTGLDEIIQLADVNLYPNPFVDIIELQLDVKKSARAQLNITDLNGKLMLQQELQLSEGLFTDQIDLSNFSNGVYLFNIIHEQEVLSRKIIKQ